VLGTTDPDGAGTGGLEKQYDQLLQGVPGSLIRERDREGRSIPLGVNQVVPPQAGSDLVLTLDRQLQHTVEELTLQRVTDTKAKGGMVVVMDTTSGDILALANVRRDDKTGRVAISAANNALVDTYEPGSVAKIIAGSGALEEGTTTLDQVWQVPGSLQVSKEHTIYDAEGPRAAEAMDMETIIARSSNIGTVLLARSIGAAKDDQYLRAFGFGATTGLGFPDESPGILPPHEKWNDAQKATIAYGQGFGVTLMQLAGAINTLANGGVYVAPRLVEATIDPSGAQHPAPPSPTHRAVSQATAQAMTTALKGVICRSDGTAKERAAVPGYPVAGKTGTAYKPQTPAYKLGDGSYDGYRDKDGNHHYVTSFEGYLPADNPQLTIVVTIDEPDPTQFQSGAVAAAPLFKLVAQEALRTQQVAPTGGDCPGAKVR
jgi:cell division protein FtsI (penicillin-binding protein 3)